uniref:Uncharacterized protein n=1 Tax=Anguilla anguilla TaxID=7936 RepID=A0A0E9SR16_ANGAN
MTVKLGCPQSSQKKSHPSLF